MKFVYEISDKEVNFLDTTVYITSENKLKTKCYIKPSDRQSYLRKNSKHPRILKKSILYGQALRIKRICSEKSDFDVNINNLKHNVLKREYQEMDIQSKIDKANAFTQQELLVNRHSDITDISTISRKQWHILHLDEENKDLFKEPPMLAFRQNKNLKDMLSNSKLKPEAMHHR